MCRDVGDGQMEYINRELSWLSFNERVLAEAQDPRTPLLERLKFLAIYGSNLDEYFMLRVSGIKRQLATGVTSKTPDGLTPDQQLQQINQRLTVLGVAQYQCYQDLLPELAAQAIEVLNYEQLTESDRQYLHTYFQEQIFPVLTPLGVDPAHPFPYLSNLSLSLAVAVVDAQGSHRLARIKVPHGLLERFVPVGRPLVFLPLEQLIAAHLDSLFPGMVVRAVHVFRVTRNADIEIQEDEAEDLLLTIEQELRRRRFGEVVRLEVDPLMPQELRQQLMEALDLEGQFVYAVPGLLDVSSLFALTRLDFPHLKETPFVPHTPLRFAEAENIFEAIKAGDVLVHHPYHNFATTVERFIHAAVQDPQVLAIKQTLYRTGGADSAMIQGLIEAAENGKQVAVLVELKARFDEANNITWARALENAGVHVVYGLVGLKTHCKVALVVRREAQGLRRYIHIGTGNYNSKTARLYTDVGVFTCDPEIGADATDLFNYLTGYSSFHTYRRLLVAPVTMRTRLVDLIQREMDLHTHEQPGYIALKMNSLVDPAMIALLYTAAQRGVRIDLIIRGICCLRPGVAGLSEQIRVISIVGRFLEHARILHFRNGGADEVYIGSADWMTRNLDKRVEVLVPIGEPTIKEHLMHYLHLSLKDNRQAWALQPDETYRRRTPAADEPQFSLQEHLLVSS
ncbi:polyphosphate kinase 1 [Candidatus Cyanaurora vandensis]|uniref:polyphosphate kinase 1 n=1 Tax=Candidatus Cyanaurora vandensis TaxID=2714958 RepID=UPI00257A9E96|nr:polyphosphate kinase 1 [Candidatus Cyanaurora vandensis]